MCTIHCSFIAALWATAGAPQHDEEEAGRVSGPPAVFKVITLTIPYHRDK